MMQKILILVLATFSGFTLAQDRDVLLDIQMGMEGLKQAGKDPELLAQLMRDMQDPEIMAAAQEMMNDIKCQAEMKKFSKSKEFKESLKTTKEMLSDPNQAAAAEARMEQMIKVGNEEMKKKFMKAAVATMDAMANNPEMNDSMVKMIIKVGNEEMKKKYAMANDPEMIVDSMAKIIMDPNFEKQLVEMMKDPNFSVVFVQMLKVGNEEIKKKSMQTVDATMDVMANDPEMIDSMAKMIIKVGNEEMKKKSMQTVDTMDAMANDPEMIDSMAKMIKDTNFQKQLDEMMKDTNFVALVVVVVVLVVVVIVDVAVRTYMESMQEMLKDPSKKAKFDQLAAGIKAALRGSDDLSNTDPVNPF
ncbi:hypothetical protein ACA910_016891 [Epithemia clementina (nom. ined.)]